MGINAFGHNCLIKLLEPIVLHIQPPMGQFTQFLWCQTRDGGDCLEFGLFPGAQVGLLHPGNSQIGLAPSSVKPSVSITWKVRIRVASTPEAVVMLSVNMSAECETFPSHL